MMSSVHFECFKQNILHIAALRYIHVSIVESYIIYTLF